MEECERGIMGVEEVLWVLRGIMGVEEVLWVLKRYYGC